MVLLDAPEPGSGQVFDWALAGEVPTGQRLMIAGGLTAENVAGAIARTRPWRRRGSRCCRGPLTAVRDLLSCSAAGRCGLSSSGLRGHPAKGSGRQSAAVRSSRWENITPGAGARRRLLAADRPGQRGRRRLSARRDPRAARRSSRRGRRA
ncbi:MAG: hypothetical protein ACRDLV_00270 [Solirubrobacteraceae bacterium]